MESHPVPQNVTSFEFHLIGDMTLKQFFYLTSGAVVAYLTYFLIFPLSPLLAIPIMIISSGLGVLFAFVPIADRPLDHWFVAFFKAVYSPTKRIWQGAPSPQFKNRLNVYLASIGAAPLPEVAATPISQAVANNPSPLTRLLSQTQENVRATTPVAAPLPSLTRIAPPPPVIARSEATKQSQEIAALPTVANSPPAGVRNDALVAKPPIVMPTVPQVSGPNIIAGTTLDPTGTPLPNVIIIIHNSDNLPVRALKTGSGGMFTGATPLPSGVYQLEPEKEGFLFDPVRVELKGEMLTPLVIQAKPGASS